MVPEEELAHDDRRSPGRWLLLLLAAGVIVPTLIFGLTRPSRTEVAPGKPAPDFELPSLSSAGTLSSDDLRGKIVVLNFWWSGCPPCKEEVPVLVDAYERFRDDGVVVVGVDIRRDSEAAARRFMDAFGVTYPVVRDEHGELTEAMRINDRYMPRTYFIKRDWTFAPLVAPGLTIANEPGIFGGVRPKQLEEQLEAMLS